MQSLSVSTPMTCDMHDKSVEIPNVLEKAVHAMNRVWLRGIVDESLASLEDEFFAAGACTQVAKMKALVREATALSEKFGAFPPVVHLPRYSA